MTNSTGIYLQSPPCYVCRLTKQYRRSVLRRYWEIVELIRKLILAGLIGFVGRGSVLQTVVALVISFMFFALTFRE